MRKLVIPSAVLVLATAVLAFRPAPPPPEVGVSAINGVWKAVHVAFASSDTSWASELSNPSITIFTDGYWSIARISGDGPRADLPEDPTDEQLLEAFRRFHGSAGTYSVSGSTVSGTTLVSRNPNQMSADNTWSNEYWMKDGKLTREYKNDENGNTWTVTFERLE
ncbi:MAG: lipocalin-like domain-containing protein [Gemmatimonadetes bacterium]|nr:lipocalin-like domain-containing protein [Gemmatimonadota bacterium]